MTSVKNLARILSIAGLLILWLFSPRFNTEAIANNPPNLSKPEAVKMAFDRKIFSRRKAIAKPETKTIDPGVTVKVTGGLISGMTLEGGIMAYKGIPFAAPPVGTLRWKPPQPVNSWEGVMKCAKYSPACPQADMSGITLKKYKETSEDCLYLNVWTPAKAVDDKFPVMVWFHGGAFMGGSASDDFYDGQDLARQGVVIVTVNYRLGPLGFLAHPLLSKESENKVSGNYGLLDQIAALKWVRDNIKAFGGDPGQVTIFGESAGGRSAASLMVCPLAKGLFHRAIMQSSTVYRPIHHLRESWYGRPSMENVGEQLARRLGCDKTADPIAALRAKSPEEIIKASKPVLAGLAPSSDEGTPFEPIVDGWIIPDDPSDLFDAGKQYSIPLIAGTNADEGSLFIQKMPVSKPLLMRMIVKKAFPDYADEIFRTFKFNTPEETYDSMNQIFGDMCSTAPMRATVSNMEKIGSKAWLYRFTHVRSDFMGKKLGVWHGSEIRFVFNSLDRGNTRVEKADRELAKIISGCWVRFAATGDPNGSGLPNWPSYDSVKKPYLEFGDYIEVKQGLNEVSCNLFEKVEKNRRANKKRGIPSENQ